MAILALIYIRQINDTFLGWSYFSGSLRRHQMTDCSTDTTYI